MPIHSIYSNNKCFLRWGNHGAKYEYTCGDEESRKEAKAKAIAQAVAAGATETEFATNQKIGFDFDEVLSRTDGKDMARKYIEEGNTVYIVSARHNAINIYPTAEELGIPKDRVYATGSNKAKIEKVIELGLDKFFDNNPDVIDALPAIGQIF